jgi:hypothetical protein
LKTKTNSASKSQTKNYEETQRKTKGKSGYFIEKEIITTP